MRRRQILALAGGASVAWPLPVRAQSAALPVIGFLSAIAPESSAAGVAAFREGLNEAGYAEGRNVGMLFKWSEGHYERLPALAAELVALRVAVIVAAGGPAAVAATRATKTIPIAFHTGGDPVETDLVASLGRPGGNATGVTMLSSTLAPKRLELLRELVPHARSVAYLADPRAPAARFQLADVQSATRTIGLDLQVHEVRTLPEIEQAFVRLAATRPHALLIGAAPLFLVHRAEIAALANGHAIPAVYEFPEFAAAGGLASYGTDLRNTYRLLGGYTGQILRGARPADMPVQQATKFELVINLKAAKALGLVVPPTILARADEVIE